MLAIGSKLRKHWVEIAWGAFAALNVLVLLSLTGWETIPFHFVWVSLTIVYGIRLWRLRTTVAVLALVMVVTGWALFHAADSPGGPGLDELTEVPLMGAMFLAMVWHAERARKAMGSEQRLRERQADFVRDASHELKTPITVARGHAELIREAVATEQLTADTDIVLDELGRLSRVAERLLVLAAAEHRDFLRRGELRVEPFLARTVRRWSATAGRTWNITSQAHGWIRGDLERLELALDSLIENAVRFTDEHDEVRVVARAHGDMLVIQVSDTGVGISEEQLPRIFERFTRADAARGRNSGGTGLGLAMVRAIVEAHGGTVGVTSRLGAGTTFTIHLPGFRPSLVLPVVTVPDEPPIAEPA